MLQHVAHLRDALASMEGQAARIDDWGSELAARLQAGARLITAGNGGSAAEAQHLAAELVGRYRTERIPLSAICLHAETSSLTAIANDYGVHEMFARQVRAHARPDDVVLLISTSGRSPNLLAAAVAAVETGATAWALTGAAPNPLASLCDDAVCFAVGRAATVQELHLVTVHLLCEVVDRELADAPAATAAGVQSA